MAGIGFDEGILQLLNRTYQFLAVRFMPVTEWAATTRPNSKEGQDPANGVVKHGGANEKTQHSPCDSHFRLSLLTARSNCAR